MRHRMIYRHQRVDIFVSRDWGRFIWSYRIADGDFVMSSSPPFATVSHALEVAMANAKHRVDTMCASVASLNQRISAQGLIGS